MNTHFKLSCTLMWTKVLLSISVLLLTLGLSAAHAAPFLNIEPLDPTLSETNPIPYGSTVSFVLSIGGLDGYPVGGGGPGIPSTFVQTMSD